MPKGLPAKAFQWSEKAAKAELDGMKRDPANDTPFAHQIGAGLTAVVGTLEQRYLADGNPVHVWDAIMQLYSGAIAEQQPLVLPNWILAYLVRAATGIMGIAVNRPALPQAGPDEGKKIRKSRTPPPKRQPDGSTARYSDWFGGCTPAERLRFANQALGFIRGQGACNAFEEAYRRQQDEDLNRAARALRCNGATDSEAAQQLKNDALRNVGDGTRKVRRVRRKQREIPKLS